MSNIFLSNDFLQEDAKDGHLRERAELYIIKDRRLLVGKDNKGEYHIPGGGIDWPEKPHEAAIREALEEAGVEATIIEKLPTYKFNYCRDVAPWQEIDQGTREWGVIGNKTYPYLAIYKKDNKSLYNSEGDGFKYKWLKADEAISCFQKNDKIWAKVLAPDIIKIIIRLKNKLIIE